MGVNRRVNLFEVHLTSPAAHGGNPIDVPIRDALAAIGTLAYNPATPGAPQNRYHFNGDHSVRYAFDFAPYGTELVAGTITRSDLDGGEVEELGARQPLVLRNGQSLAHATHFLLNPERREILVESTAGARYTDIARYLQSRLDGNMNVPIEACRLKQIVDEDALDRFLNEKGSLASFEVVVERHELSQFDQAADLGQLTDARVIKESLDAASRISQTAEVITVRLGRERGKRSGGMGSIVKNALVEIATHLGASTYKLQGRVENKLDDSGRLESFNLLNARTSALIENIATTTARKHIDSNDMLAKMAAAYNDLERG